MPADAVSERLSRVARLPFCKCPSVSIERKGILVAVGPRERSRYCLSYTAVYLTVLPFESVPLTVTVRLLPSADMTI